MGEVERRALRRGAAGSGAGAGELRSGLVELARAQAHLARLTHAAPDGEEPRARWREEYAKTAARCDELSLSLAARSAAFREASARLGIGLAEVRRALFEGEVLVDYLRYRDRYAAWILGRDGPARRVELGPAAPVEEAARRFREAVRDAPSDDAAPLAAAGAELRKLVWTPLEVLRGAGAGAGAIYVVPDDALAAVPFAVLPGRAAGP